MKRIVFRFSLLIITNIFVTNLAQANDWANVVKYSKGTAQVIGGISCFTGSLVSMAMGKTTLNLLRDSLNDVQSDGNTNFGDTANVIVSPSAAIVLLSALGTVTSGTLGIWALKSAYNTFIK